MLKNYAYQYMRLGYELNDLSTSLYMDDVDDVTGDGKTPVDNVVEVLNKLKKQCEAFGLTTSKALIDAAIKKPPKTNGEFEIYVRAIVSELHDKLFLFVPTSRSRYFSFECDAAVTSKFPSALYDVDESAKCLALGRGTASVFHSMKVVEHVLIAVHHCLGIGTPLVGNSKNWGSILGRIKDEIGRRSKWSEKDFFQELYARLDAVKDAWRNSTMHVEKKYTPDEAEEIFKLTMRTLENAASRMDEKGAPQA